MALSDTLFEIRETLSKDLFDWTTGCFKDKYETDIIFEVQDILNRIDSLRSKLDTPPDQLTCSFRFNL